jgi:hypothetical protein
MRQTQWGFLLNVGNADPKLGTVTDRGDYFLSGFPDDDSNLTNASPGHCFDSVKQDWLVGNRHKLLGIRMGDGSQARTRTAGQNETLHTAHHSR